MTNNREKPDSNKSILKHQILQKFIDWTKLKFKIHLKEEIKFYFKEREIWWASLGENIGQEQSGKNENFERPVVIIKKFSRNLLWIVPTTSKKKTGPFYSQFQYKGVEYFVILHQLRTISSKRLVRKIRKLETKEFNKIKENIKKLL